MITILSSILAFVLGAISTGLVLLKKLSKKNEENIALKAQLSAKSEIEANEKNMLELIKKEFTSSANEILIERQKNLQEQNKVSLESFLSPLKEKIKEFQKKVEAADEAGKINTATIKTKIEELVRQNQITTAQTEKLSNAISQNSKFRGTLGEMLLDRLLKSSGLINKKDNPNGNYETQIGFRAGDDSGSVRIADVVVYLSGGTKSIVIDSKASLTNFIEYMETKNENSLNAFFHDIQARVSELSGKYTNLEGLNTPDFTIMFMPFEAPLSYIYSNNKLVEYALRENIIIAGPSTLIATLRTINYSWAQKSQYENIKEIAKLGIGIYEKCVTLIQKIEGVQTSFDTVRKKFDDVFATAKGRGGLLRQVERLREMGLSPAKEIDKKYLEENII